MAVSGYLPPILIRVLGDDKDFVSTLNKDKAMLLSFAKETAQAHLGLNQDQFRSGLLNAKSELLTLTGKEQDVKLGVDTAPLVAGLAKAKAEVSAFTKSIPWAKFSALNVALGALGSTPIKGVSTPWSAGKGPGAIDAALATWASDYGLSQLSGTSSPWKKYAGINSALAGWGASQAVSGGGGGRGGILGFLGGLFGGKGGGGGGAGLMSMLGWGGGMFGMAGVGSLLSYGGLGAEHLLMTGVGLAGNAAGGMLGGGLLGLGSLGVGAVGMGTDMAGIGQAMNDAKQYSAAVNNLQQVQAAYKAGTASAAQLAAAQQQVNYTLSGMPAAAQGAIVSLVATKNQFRNLFDQLTGPAEKIGAQILQQAMQVGEKFLPTIGKFAAENMGIIKSDLQPLFGWLQGPGLQIFTNLEKKFQSDLPTAMTAFDNGIELLMKTINLIAPQTGGFIKWLAKITTEFNGPKWGSWSAGVNKLIGDFRQWEGLIKILVADVYQLFHNDAGTGSAIVVTLTQMLTKLHAWETSVSGKNSLHNLFETHKQEVVALLHLLPSLISGFGKVEMTVAPQMTTILTAVVKVVDALLKIPGVGPILAWVAAMGFLANKMNVLKPLVSGLTAGFDRLMASMADSVTAGGLETTFTGIENAARSASTEVANLGATTVTSAAETSGLWLPASAEMDRVATSAEGMGANIATAGEEAAVAAEGGIGTMSAGLGGMLGPIGLVAGAIGVSLIPAFIGLFKHGPSATQETAKGIQQMSQTLSQLPTGSVLQMGNDLDTINRDMQNVTKSMQGLKPGSAAMEVAGGKMVALYQSSLSVNTQMATMQGNVAGLAKTFGISQTDVQNFANEVGINLKKKLDPAQLQLFDQALSQSGQAFDNSVTKSANWATGVAANLAKGVKAAEAQNSTLVNSFATSMNLTQLIMGKGSVLAMAAFVNGQQGGLHAVEAVARQYGITIPQNYLNQLDAAMGAGGQVSMQKLASGLASSLPAVAQALGGISPLVDQVKWKEVAAAAASGAAIGNALAGGVRAQLLADAPNMAAAGALAVAQTIGAMHKAAQTGSPSKLTMQLGAWMTQGLELGMLSRLGQAATAGRTVTLAAVNGGRFAAMGAGNAGAGSTAYGGTNSATYNVTFNVPGGNPQEIERIMQRLIDQNNKQQVAGLRMGSAWS